MKRSVYFAFLLGAFLAICFPLCAQVGTQGAIVGTVRDSSGAVIPGAKVTVIQLETGLKKSAITDAGGDFEIVALPIGPYSVTVSANGFKTWELERAVLTVGARLRVSPALQVGATRQQVTVNANAKILQTENSSVNTVIDIKPMLNFPLPLRNPVSLVELVPGMRFSGVSGPEHGAYVYGMGVRSNATNFVLDGVNSNAAMDEGGMDLPVVDDVAEMNVQTSTFSAESGRDPFQVTLVTKSGTNEFHGSLWEYLQNDALNARNAFSARVPRLRYNQFGGNFGGPVQRDRTFFFGSFQATLIPGQIVYNEFAPTAAMLNGDLSSVTTPIKDPLTGQPFPGNVIPSDRINSASKFFIPYLPQANTPGNLYTNLATNTNNTYEYTARVDHYITEKQRIYGRWVHDSFETTGPSYLPSFVSSNDTAQDNAALNYMYTIRPDILLTATAGYLRSDNTFTSPLIGKVNYAEEAGIQGIPTQGREQFIGLPEIDISGYPGIILPFGLNGALWSRVEDGTVELRIMKAKHSIGFGYEFQNRSTFGKHGSQDPRGQFSFNGQYTGNGLADYLLGLTSFTERNLPLNTFGLKDAPYSGLYVQDFWHALPNLTLNLGLRYEHWHSMSFIAGNTTTFDLKTGQVVAGEDSSGQVNLNQQPVAPFLAQATAGLWIPASQANLPKDIFPARGHVEPRVGFAWRPSNKNDLVVRGGYGVYENSFTGNRGGSTIGSIPFFSLESETFSASQLQNWQTAWPANPQNFVRPSVNYIVSPTINQSESQEWNVSVQKALPLNSALTLSYVGSNITGQPFAHSYNDVPPGQYTNLQAVKPYPAFGIIYLMENGIHTWYNGLQAEWERRFNNGLYFMLSYCYSKAMSNYADATGELSLVTPFAPPRYDRGPLAINNTHNLKISAVYDLPFGRGRKFFPGMNRLENAALGGWELGGYYGYVSGAPLTITVQGATLGNGWGTRADLVGNPQLSNPSANLWFNTAAFAAPPLYTFGNSGIGDVYGPSIHQMNLALMKNFHVTESKYFQIRAEAYNAFNNVNLNAPNTTFGTPTFGRIFGAAGARSIQLGAKFVF
ncbi:MAG TPA: carboxypeptidase regulatory-like domain-containing protein [Terriglobia bacterium]|nr:carboxypeptidase regulatory-like domain-containing protein [Terriglobia bacterium]